MLLADDEVRDLLAGRGVHLGALTDVLARRYGARPAVTDDAPSPGLHAGGLRTYVDLEDAVGRLAAAHRAAGRLEGQRVLLLVGNRIDILLHTFALARIGAVSSPVNPRLTAGEIAAIAEATGAAVAVADPSAVAALSDGGAQVEVVATGSDGSGGLATWLEAHPEARVEPDRRDPADTVLLPTTSGTTGTPKAAALTSRGLLSSAGRLMAAPVGRQRGARAGRDRALAALPLTHIMGFMVATVMLCAGVPLWHRERFDADEVLDLLEAERHNVFVGVPTMYADLEAAGADGRDLSAVQLWVSSADAMPPDRARRFQRYGAAARVAGRPIGTAAFLDVYGMVELSGAAAVRVYPPSPVGAVPVPPVAAVLPGIEVRAVGDDGDPVGRAEVGELQFRGAGVLRGYEGREGGPDGEGWFSTGDHGRVWPGGFFSFAGRHRDRLKVGGFSVFPAEVEEELRQAPGVVEVALVGLSDDRLGERPVAVVVAHESFDGASFLEWAEQRVAGYRRPRDVVVLEALPRGNNGKIDRRRATELAEERLGS